MLALTRRRGEIVNIGNDISVIILDVDAHGNVVLGFDAPKNVPIWRAEIDEGQGSHAQD